MVKHDTYLQLPGSLNLFSFIVWTRKTLSRMLVVASRGGYLYDYVKVNAQGDDRVAGLEEDLRERRIPKALPPG